MASPRRLKSWRAENRWLGSSNADPMRVSVTRASGEAADAEGDTAAECSAWGVLATELGLVVAAWLSLGCVADVKSGTGTGTGRSSTLLGEEEIETPAGRFRALHLRAMTDKTTEVWIALDRQRLPVRIRFTDKKGESFEQVATEIGSP